MKIKSPTPTTRKTLVAIISSRQWLLDAASKNVIAATLDLQKQQHEASVETYRRQVDDLEKLLEMLE